MYTFNCLRVNSMSKIVSTRISEDLEKELKLIEEVEKTDRATVIRKLLSIGVSEWKKKYALDLYREGKVSLWKAAKIAGLSLWEMIDLLAKEKVLLNYTIEDLREDIEAALEG